MYVASAAQTPQGRAIKDASMKFGDGQTLPFTPCKKGYIPLVAGMKMYACPLHTKQRERRVKREGGRYRRGEFPLNRFWDNDNEESKKEMP